MSAYEFTAQPRAQFGSASSRRLRGSSQVPGVVYGPDHSPTAISMSHHQMYQLMKNEKFHSTIVQMNIEGKLQPVLLKDYQMHPYKPLLVHIDFQFVSDKREVNMTVPLHFVGAELSPGVKVGHGIPSHVMVQIDISCLPKNLPSAIEVDMSALALGDSVHARDLKLPEGVKLAISKSENPVVAAILAPAAEEIAVPATTAAPAATPAKGAAPAKASAAPAKAAPAAAPAKAPAKK